MEQSICIFGASSTQGFYDILCGGWADRLKILLYKRNLKSKDYFTVFNLGVDGNTSRDLLNRFHLEVLARNPSIIIISLGDNDCALKVPLNEFERNMRGVLLDAKKFTKNILLLGSKKVDESLTCPVSWDNNVFYRNEEIEKYTAILEKLSTELDLEYLPMKGILENEDLQDGLHPNTKGHKKIFEEVQKALQNKGWI
jgi:lysophospholipase L1-like esterase